VERSSGGRSFNGNGPTSTIAPPPAAAIQASERPRGRQRMPTSVAARISGLVTPSKSVTVCSVAWLDTLDWEMLLVSGIPVRWAKHR
jgi:hypothetical protein